MHTPPTILTPSGNKPATTSKGSKSIGADSSGQGYFSNSAMLWMTDRSSLPWLWAEASVACSGQLSKISIGITSKPRLTQNSM